MCVDYRRLNDVTEKPVFVLPDSTYLFDQLSGCKYFCSIDMCQGYHQIKINETDVPKTAFTSKTGHYAFIRMPFGLLGALMTFQKNMNHILKGLNWKICLIYLDNICIFSNTLKEHKERLRNVRSAIKNSGIKLSPKKCSFLKKN